MIRSMSERQFRKVQNLMIDPLLNHARLKDGAKRQKSIGNIERGLSLWMRADRIQEPSSAQDTRLSEEILKTFVTKAILRLEMEQFAK
jgi:hypothetical protein